jgi:hypothetical protein
VFYGDEYLGEGIKVAVAQASKMQIPGRTSSREDQLDSYILRLRKVIADSRNEFDALSKQATFYSTLHKDTSLGTAHIILTTLLTNLLASAQIRESSFQLAGNIPNNLTPSSLSESIKHLLEIQVTLSDLSIPLASILVKCATSWGALSKCPSLEGSSVLQEFASNLAFSFTKCYQNVVRVLPFSLFFASQKKKKNSLFLF